MLEALPLQLLLLAHNTIMLCVLVLESLHLFLVEWEVLNAAQFLEVKEAGLRYLLCFEWLQFVGE